MNASQSALGGAALDGTPVTSPARSLIDLAATMGPTRARAAIRRALGLGRVAPTQIGDALERYPGRRGTSVIRAAFAFGVAPTRSDRETHVLDAGFAHPDADQPLALDGRRIIPDFRWAERR
jgi:hypothetical protein